MAEILFDPNGRPLLAHGSGFMATTTGLDSVSRKQVSTVSPDLDYTVTVGTKTVASWGDNNDFPNEAEKIINKTGVLNTGLQFIQRFTLGQGIFPCKVEGYDDDGNEVLKVVNDPKITSFVSSRMVRRYMANALRDYLKFGVAFPEVIPNIDASQIVGIDVKNALFARYLEKKNGIIPGVIVSGDWPDSPSDYKTIDLLDPFDPFSHLNGLRILKKIKGKTFIYPLRNEWSNNEYYPVPLWHSAHVAGWTSIAQKVPSFLMKMYENQISFKWHIKIPYAYWERRYPENNFKSLEDRQAAIQAEMDSIEENLTGPENAHKALFSMFEVNPSGRAEEQWEIENLADKNKPTENLVTSAAANSEILFALMINPNVFGAGMPGGTYAGNQGGSNIREAFLVNIALAWLDRQNILDPLELMLEFNGIKDIELRFRNTILTTLDTGSGTQNTLS
ncbi:hypothetical protein ACT29H_09385 [Thermophagus sp. OGC60D27]|uniref:hypothetical protein n=1 Tax=Thermophagus sp. OGC60D27 TaxID=3458415 RepID=UPI0040381A1F